MGKRDSGEVAAVDLLGDPVQPIRDPRGRKSAVANATIRKEIQTVVMSMRSVGKTQEDIAQYLHMDAKTLRKYFSRELDHGAMLLEGMAMQVLVKKMLDGNVSAAKEVQKICAARSAPRSSAPKQPKAPPLGKKDQLNNEARTPTLGWGDVLPN
ncbi:hypothetical protein [Tabrizicola sp. M-4]|uniref:hypothetical protein n=1 Tax=Tabrizicola sp. M-4 TaxID=3055847 RepID=UPI003DA8DAC6